MLMLLRLLQHERRHRRRRTCVPKDQKSTGWPRHWQKSSSVRMIVTQIIWCGSSDQSHAKIGCAIRTCCTVALCSTNAPKKVQTTGAFVVDFWTQGYSFAKGRGFEG